MAHCVAQLYCAVLRQVCLIDEAPPESPMSVTSPTHAHTRKLQTQRCTSLVNNLSASLVIIQRSVCANGTSPKPEILLRLSHRTKN